MNKQNRLAIENLNALQDLIIPDRGFNKKDNEKIELSNLQEDEDYLNAQDMLEELKAGQEEL